MDLACAMMWGFKDYDGLNKLQNRAIRLYLGIGKFTPISFNYFTNKSTAKSINSFRIKEVL
jgi:hypothetical protein